MFLGEVFIKNMRSLDVGSRRAGDIFFLCDIYLLTCSGVLLRKSENMIILVLKVQGKDPSLTLHPTG